MFSPYVCLHRVSCRVSSASPPFSRLADGDSTRSTIKTGAISAEPGQSVHKSRNPHLPRPINNLHTPTPPPAPPPCYSTYKEPNMPAPATVQINRAEINRSNARNSTGPRTESCKQRSSQNALRHCLTARTPAIPSEDPAAYQQH